MVTTSSLRAFSVPTVGGDGGVWGNELNTTIGDLDTILGGSITFNSSAAATVTLSTSQAQFGRIVFSGTPASSMTLNFSSNAGSFGNYDVWNATSTSANGGAGFNLLCQVTSTSTGATATIPISNMRMVNVDGQNVQFADQVIVPTVTLPPILNNYLTGLAVSNSTAGSSVGSSNSFLAMAAGIATDTTAASYLQNAASFIKTSSAAWASGSLNGGMGSGLTFTAATTYHVFIISNGTSSNIDMYFDTSATAANKPANTNFFRRIMSLPTMSSAAVWPAIVQRGDEVLYVTSLFDQNSVSVGAANRSLLSFTVPTGIVVYPQIRWAAGGGAVAGQIIFTSPDESDQVGDFVSAGHGGYEGITPSTPNFLGGRVTFVRSNISGQIGVRASGGAFNFSAFTLGWIDTRGRDVLP